MSLLAAAILCTRTTSATTPLILQVVTGGTAQPLAVSKNSATVLFFIAHDCPISNSYAPEINRIALKYSAKNVSFFAVYAEGETTLTVERQHAQAYGFHFPALADPHSVLATRVNATITPEAIVLSPKAKVLYRGRIDDTYAAIGIRRLKPTTHDLQSALDQILAGQPVKHPNTQTLGCYIPKAS